MYAKPENAGLWRPFPESPFAGLAAASGFSVRDCRLAAAAGGDRLAAIVRAAEQRRTPRARAAHEARRRLLEVRRRMMDLEAR
jgi:hypothetical protein